MSLYIWNDLTVPLFLPYKTQSEISMLRTLNRKRMVTKVIKSPDYLELLQSDPEAVLLIPELRRESESAVIYCNRHNIPVIVLHSPASELPQLTYNSVCGHPRENARLIIRYCLSNRKNRLALFGFNNADIDIAYARAVYTLLPTFKQEDFFQITSGFEECFDRFFARRNEYNAILFANDYIAINFLEKIASADKKYTDNRFLIGISDSLISKLYFKTVTSLTYSRKSVFNSVAAVYRSIIRNKNHIAGLNCLLMPEIYVRQTTQNVPFDAYDVVLPHISDNKKPDLKIVPYSYSYSGNKLLTELLEIENFLNSLDRQGFLLVYHMMCGMNVMQIAETLNSSQQALQYHTKQMFIQTGTKNRREFVKLLSHYISKEHLLDFINTSPLFNNATTPPKK